MMFHQNKCFWSQNQHIRMTLKDHVTLKTGAMAAENSALPSQEKYNILKYVQIENSYINCNNILQYYCIYHIFDQINAALMSIKVLSTTLK